MTSPIAYDIRGSVAASGRSRTRIYTAIKNGELNARKDGFRTIILAEDLKHWLQSLPSAKASSDTA